MVTTASRARESIPLASSNAYNKSKVTNDQTATRALGGELLGRSFASPERSSPIWHQPPASSDGISARATDSATPWDTGCAAATGHYTGELADRWRNDCPGTHRSKCTEA